MSRVYRATSAVTSRRQQRPYFVPTWGSPGIPGHVQHAQLLLSMSGPNDWEQAWLIDISKQKRLTERQWDCLDRIARKIGAPVSLLGYLKRGGGRAY
jgi:hypothetical protein